MEVNDIEQEAVLQISSMDPCVRSVPEDTLLIYAAVDLVEWAFIRTREASPSKE